MTEVAAAIPTFGRVDGVERAIRSVLRDPVLSTLIVVDQNLDERLLPVIAAVADPRVQHIRTRRSGAGRARNIALEVADAEVLCCMDDDCEAPPGWASALAGAVLEDDKTGLVFSSVEAAPGQGGFTPAKVFSDEEIFDRWDREPTIGQLGLGASYAVRVAAARAIGGWDDYFGPGGEYHSADDYDLAYRMLHFGWSVRCLPQPSVVHFGNREDGRAVRQLFRRDHLAIGAMLGKLAKVAPRRAASMGARFLISSFGEFVRASVRLRRLAGFGRIFWTIVGLGRMARRPVDRETARIR